MWLLSTDRAKLYFFFNLENVPGPYAILSHAWGNNEQSFSDIDALHAECEGTGCNPRDLASHKIRNFCVLAESHGYQWGWVDTCCINKENAAELSEAIYSMYALYEASDACYAYLDDVQDDDNPLESGSDFRKSRWHKRSWLLQELLAPKRVVFLSHSWRILGSKTSLITPLTECTGIDRDILLGAKAMETASVAQRMSWAACRNSTRSEDRAYALMGIFGVTMPLIYGEGGESAFFRLQKEVIALHRDQTIFAWGFIHPSLEEAQDFVQNVLTSEHHGAHLSSQTDYRSLNRGLLAASPADFVHSAHLRPLNGDRYMQLFRQVVDHTYTFSTGDVTLRLPISSDFVCADTGIAVHAAALACTDDSEASMIFLFLSRSRAPLDRQDTFPQEWSFSGVGQVTRTTDGELQYYRGARWIFPIPRLRWPLNPTPTPTSTPSSRKSALAHVLSRQVRVALVKRHPLKARTSAATLKAQSKCIYLTHTSSTSVSNLSDSESTSAPSLPPAE